MSVIITPTEVLDGFSTTVSESEIPLYISIADAADACLDANQVPDDTQRALKLLAVRHMLTMQANGGRGNVTSESAPSGASRSYGKYSGKEGSHYGDLLERADRWGCVTSVVNSQATVGMWSIGGCR